MPRQKRDKGDAFIFHLTWVMIVASGIIGVGGALSELGGQEVVILRTGRRYPKPIPGNEVITTGKTYSKQKSGNGDFFMVNR